MATDQPQHFAATALAQLRAKRKPLRNVNKEHKESLSPLERVAVSVTDKVGTMGFFLIIFTWTILWCGYNIVATEVSTLHWKSFDPFPAFVAYLLMSNVIQILLMPLIMVGQNLQGRHSETRAELDFQVNLKNEISLTEVLRRLDVLESERLPLLFAEQDKKISELKSPAAK